MQIGEESKPTLVVGGRWARDLAKSIQPSLAFWERNISPSDSHLKINIGIAFVHQRVTAAASPITTRMSISQAAASLQRSRKHTLEFLHCINFVSFYCLISFKIVHPFY
jgi:hypothetical protein